jgi:hypothetical protein
MAVTVAAGDGLAPRGFMFALRVDHPMQMGYSVFNIVMFILSCSALRREHSTAVHVFKISIRKLVMPLRIRSALVIYP